VRVSALSVITSLQDARRDLFIAQFMAVHVHVSPRQNAVWSGSWCLIIATPSTTRRPRAAQASINSVLRAAMMSNTAQSLGSLAGSVGIASVALRPSDVALTSRPASQIGKLAAQLRRQNRLSQLRNALMGFAFPLRDVRLRIG
jgi:hypothetical protein